MIKGAIDFSLVHFHCYLVQAFILYIFGKRKILMFNLNSIDLIYSIQLKFHFRFNLIMEKVQFCIYKNVDFDFIYL